MDLIETAGEVQLKKYGSLLSDYSQKLHTLSEALGECNDHSWDLTLDPLALNIEPHENISIFQLLEGENRPFEKMLAAMASTCLATTEVQQEANELCQSLLFYGEGPIKETSSGAVFVSRMLGPLQNVLRLVRRTELILATALDQLAALTLSFEVKGGLFSSAPPELHFQPLVDAIAQLLLVIITIKEVLSGCTMMQTHWSLFKRTLKAAAQESTSGSRLLGLQSVVHELEKKLVSGDCFKACLRHLAEAKSGAGSASIGEQLLRYTRTEVAALEIESGQHLSWVRASAIYVLAAVLYGVNDKKTFRAVWEPHKRISAVHLMGTSLWLPEAFFSSYLPNVQQYIEPKTKSAIGAAREGHLQQKSQFLPKDAQVYYFIVCDWLIQMDSCMRRDSTQLKLEDLHTKCSIILQGLDFLQSIGNIVKTIFSLHVHLAIPILKSSMVHLCKLIELMKNIQFMYFSKSIAIAESTNHIIQHLTYQCLVVLGNVKKNVPADNKKNSRARQDVLSAFEIMERCLQGPCIVERRLLVKLALAAANQLKSFQGDELSHLKQLLTKLDGVCELQQGVRAAADCAFLYWHRVVLPIYFTRLFEERADLRRLKYMFSALDDCSQAMRFSKHLPDAAILQNQFKSEMYTALKFKLLEPLCQEIETDLRLRVHSHLRVDNKDQNQSRPGCQTMLLHSHPVRFFDEHFSPKAFVENYLSETFYNLTTVALHDWKTYGEMRIVAREKYGLATVEDHLPSQTLEQGLDALEIMRNIHIFVSSHVYNLNNQMFIETASSNKYLNTITVQHNYNSIRTHGTGIINTTVNFTYQFLKKKFQVVSQFLFDDRVKSRLIKDMRHFQETKEQSEQMYPFARAEKFNQGLSKLATSPEGLGYLVEFRSHVTQIGNAMGYVRMMRSGSRQYMSKAICFIPDLEDVVSFEKLAEEDGMSGPCIRSAKELDEVASALVSNFDRGIEYFQLLVDVFAPVSKDINNSHLKLFYSIVPALTINFVEYIVTCKDRLNKNVKDGAVFTDDGFAMGVAYLLRVLDLDREFDSLNWFKSVEEKYKTEKESLKEQMANVKKGDVKLKNALILTEKRLEIYQQEFELLFYNVSSARIFFKKQPVDGQKEE